MAFLLNDRVKETTTTTGTSTINLAGAETGFESFVAGIGNSNTTYYAIVHQTADEFEVGIGTVTDASPDTLSRTTIISSSNSDAAVNFSSGTKDVFCTLPASKAVFYDNSSGSSDVAIGNRGTNPMGLSITGTVLAVSDSSGVASVQIDGVTGTRIDMGTNSSRNSVFYTDANQLEISRTTNHPIIFKVNSSEIARFISTELKLASGKKLVGGGSGVDLTIQSEHRTEIRGGASAKGTILLSDAGTVYGLLERPTSTNDFDIQNPISDGDITFVGNDGGSTITALTLDMSDAGSAYFNNKVGIGTTSPSHRLTVNSGSTAVSAKLITTAATGYLQLDNSGGSSGILSNGDALGIFTTSSGTERLRISDNGFINLPSQVSFSGTGDAGLGHHTNNYMYIYGGTAGLILQDNSGGSNRVLLRDSNTIEFETNGSTRMSLDSSGNLVASGNITAYGSPSDIKLKENIEVIDNALDKVKQLKGITYDLKSDGNRLTGLIAQDLEKVLPEAVYTAKDLEDEEHLAIRYGNTVGLLVEAIKEQQEQIEVLTAKVKELEGK